MKIYTIQRPVSIEENKQLGTSLRWITVASGTDKGKMERLLKTLNRDTLNTYIMLDPDMEKPQAVTRS